MISTIYDQLYLYYDVDGHLTISMKVLAAYFSQGRASFSVPVAVWISWEDSGLIHTWAVHCLSVRNIGKRAWYTQTDGDKSVEAYYVVSVLCERLDDKTEMSFEYYGFGKGVGCQGEQGRVRVTVRQLREIEDCQNCSGLCWTGTDSKEINHSISAL